MAGYEGADHCNSAGVPLDMQVATGHEARVDEDYEGASSLGLLTVRESLSWRTIDRPDGFDFERAPVLREGGLGAWSHRSHVKRGIR